MLAFDLRPSAAFCFGHSEWEDDVDLLARFVVGVAAAWITPDPAPQQGHTSAYEERCAEPRCHLRLVR